MRRTSIHEEVRRSQVCSSGLGGEKFHIEILGLNFSRGFSPLACSVLRLTRIKSTTECLSSLKFLRITTQLRSAAGRLTHINKFSILVQFSFNHSSPEIVAKQVYFFVVLIEMMLERILPFQIIILFLQFGAHLPVPALPNQSFSSTSLFTAKYRSRQQIRLGR